MKKREGGQTTAEVGFMHTLRLAFIRPVTIMQESIVFLTFLACAIQQASLFCWYIAYPLIFQRVYQFDERRQGLTFLPIFGGNILGVVVIIICDKLKYQKARVIAMQTGTRVEPELRLFAACIGTIATPISIFW